MAEEYKSAEELRREIAELKIRLAFHEKFEDEVNEILTECENPDPDMLKAVREAEEGLLEEISQRHRKSLRNIRRVLQSAAGRVAAMVVVGLLISVSSAMAAIQMLRMGIFELNLQSNNRRISVRAIQTGEAEVPEGWDGYYYPTFIPEGFEFECIDDSGAWYFNEQNDWMVFEESGHGERMSVDTENAKISNAQINGMNATIVEKEGASAVIWMVGKRYFVVDMIGGKEEAIQVAASVIMVR